MTRGKQPTIKQYYDRLEEIWLKYDSTQTDNLILTKGRVTYAIFSL
jgi:hypothetical protein